MKWKSYACNYTQDSEGYCQSKMLSMETQACSKLSHLNETCQLHHKKEATNVAHRVIIRQETSYHTLTLACQSKANRQGLVAILSDTKHCRASWQIKKRLNLCIALHGKPISELWGVTPIWDHTVLPATQHMWTRPAIIPASQAGTHLPTPEGWKAELT